MSSKDAHLLNPRPANLRNGREISSSNSLSFTSTLSSLINAPPSSRPSKPTSARIKPKKDELFHKPNRHAAKRAKLDLTQTEEGEGLDGDIWARSQRKMREKTRLYRAMKRGDLEDESEKYAVDFERKWAEGHPDGEDGASDADDKDGTKDPPSAEEEEDGEEEEVEYIDEFGRTRHGPASHARLTTRISRARADLDSDKYTSRPLAPSNLITGDTIQHAAWQPDEVIAEQMATLAGKRDRSLTPPAEEHFDGGKEEGRRRGTGWYAFSKDEGERKRQMEGLEELRGETVRVRAEKERQRGRKQAEDFLDELGEELGVKGEGEGGGKEENQG